MNIDKPEETQWFERAEKDLKAAKDSLDSENLEWACFQAHQAAEKALKAKYIKEFKELLKTHDLVLLAKKVGVEQNIVEQCIRLNAVYVESRYPDKPALYTQEDASRFIKYSEEVLAWIKKTL